MKPKNYTDKSAMLVGTDADPVTAGPKYFAENTPEQEKENAEIPAFSFFPVLLQFWESDEEFPPQIKILWDDQTMRYLNFETTYYLQSDLLKRLQEIL